METPLINSIPMTPVDFNNPLYDDEDPRHSSLYTNKREYEQNIRGIKDNASDVMSHLHTDEYQNMVPSHKIRYLESAISDMEENISRLAQITSDAIENIDSVVRYVDRTEGIIRQIYNVLDQRIDKIKNAGVAYIITGGKDDAQNTQGNSGMDKTEKPESL